MTSLEINSGSNNPKNSLKTFWSLREFDISRGLDLRRLSTSGPVPVCIKHLDHQDFQYSIDIVSPVIFVHFLFTSESVYFVKVKQGTDSLKATVRIFLAPRYTI